MWSPYKIGLIVRKTCWHLRDEHGQNTLRLTVFKDIIYSDVSSSIRWTIRCWWPFRASPFRAESASRIERDQHNFLFLFFNHYIYRIYELYLYVRETKPAWGAPSGTGTRGLTQKWWRWPTGFMTSVKWNKRFWCTSYTVVLRETEVPSVRSLC